MFYQLKYETTVDAQGHWAVCEEGAGDVVADLMTQEIAEKICVLLNNEVQS